MSTTRFAAGFAVVGLLWCTACATTQAPSDPPPVTSSGSSDPVKPRALPVYYVVDTAAGLRLYREFHRVPTDDPASDAVRDMLARDRGIDPDYRSYWPVGTQLHSPVRHDDGVITVDLTEPARTAQVGAALAELMVQQLVYTVQGALQVTDPVRILVEGEPVAELWGHVATGEPIHRADPYATRSLVQINAPADGAEVSRTFTVTGEAAAFEATVPWAVLRGGAVVRSGFAMTLEGQRFSAFSFPLTLEPGEYVVRVVEDDPSGGAGRPPFEDTKRIRVRG